jgi:hypothetical protein
MCRRDSLARSHCLKILLLRILSERKKSEQLISEPQLLSTPQAPSLFQLIDIQYRLTCRNLLRQDALHHGKSYPMVRK